MLPIGFQTETKLLETIQRFSLRVGERGEVLIEALPLIYEPSKGHASHTPSEESCPWL